jgi:hypothetical protein
MLVQASDVEGGTVFCRAIAAMKLSETISRLNRQGINGFIARMTFEDVR